MKGHTKEVCYKLVGYLTVSAHNMVFGNSVPHPGQSDVKANTCNMMTEESRPRLKHSVGFGNKQAEVGFYPFTKEPYNQILSLLKNGGNTTALTVNYADLTGYSADYKFKKEGTYF